MKIRLIFSLLLALTLSASATQINFKAFGDSETNPGTGASVPATTSYIPLLAAAKNYAVTNYAVSGDEAGDQATPIYALSPGPDTISTYMIAENNQRHWGLTPVNLVSYHDTMMAELAWLAINNADVIRGTNAGWIYSGSWSPTTAYGLGKNTSTNGDTATVMLSGTVIYLAMIQQDGCGGKYNVALDGADKGTYDCAPASAITTFNGKSYMPKLLRFNGLAPGSHTLVVTSVATTAPVNKTYIDWAWGNSMRTAGPYPKVYLGTPLPNTAAGYIANGGSLLATEAYRDIDLAITSALCADGLSVTIADGFLLINTATDISIDGTHPNDSGYQREAGAFATVMN